jgi:hypothetical protein
MRWRCGGVAWKGVGIRVNLLEEAGGKWSGRSEKWSFGRERKSGK